MDLLDLDKENQTHLRKVSYRTITLSEKKGIKAVIGVLKGKTTTVIQSYIFDKNKFTVDEAKAWLKAHNAEELIGTEETNQDKE